jgi:hypothetical protein
MSLFRSSSVRLLGLATAVALGEAACSGSTSPSTLLTQPQAALLADGITFDAEGEISDATSTGGTVVYTDAPPVGGASLSPQCTPTRSPASPPDADADGVPDSVQFTLSNCILTYGSTETDTLNGTILFQDPTKTTADNNVMRTYVSTVRVRFRSSAHSSETWSGVRTMTRDATTLHSTATNFTTSWVFPTGGTASHTRNWTSTFTADTPGSITADQTLPSGTWNISGTSTWNSGGTAYNVSITTNALHYNATCPATPRFDSGSLTAAVTLGTGSGTVTISVTGCGVTHITNS